MRGGKQSFWFEFAGGVLALIGICGIAWWTLSVFGSGGEQDSLAAEATQVERVWDEAPAKGTVKIEEPDDYKPGDVVGVLKVPAWGEKASFLIVNGTRDEDLRRGVGKYPESVSPGQVGNLAIAGHRSGSVQPFRRLLDLKEGEKVIVRTKQATYTYKVTSRATKTTLKAADGGWVVHNPEVDEAKTKATITLTTCTHLYRSDDRSVLFGELVETKKRNSQK